MDHREVDMAPTSRFLAILPSETNECPSQEYCKWRVEFGRIRWKPNRDWRLPWLVGERGTSWQQPIIGQCHRYLGVSKCGWESKIAKYWTWDTTNAESPYRKPAFEASSGHPMFTKWILDAMKHPNRVFVLVQHTLLRPSAQLAPVHKNWSARWKIKSLVAAISLKLGSNLPFIGLAKVNVSWKIKVVFPCFPLKVRGVLQMFPASNSDSGNHSTASTLRSTFMSWSQNGAAPFFEPCHC